MSSTPIQKVVELGTRALDFLYENPAIAVVLVFVVIKAYQSLTAPPFPEAGGRVQAIESAQDWEAALERAEENDGLVVADFYATWCPPCRAAAPVFGQLSTNWHGDFYKIDVDRCGAVARREGIAAMPTFKLYRGKRCLDTIQGFNEATIVAALTKHGAVPRRTPPPVFEATTTAKAD
mmetsp:Transcript_27955/g.85778  ORF Transcript_27955/g.85778 Transcript_27955/m.85778 type:complete len:178 (-) Transcript_27955:728-1261(-)